MTTPRITPRTVAQCFKVWKTRLMRHKGPHVCIRDLDHERGCLCACGTQRRETT